MSRSFLVLFAIIAFAFAPEARAARLSLPDESGQPTRSDHVQYCEDNRWVCSQQFGASSKGPHHGLTHCRISYDQCLNRGAGAAASR